MRIRVLPDRQVKGVEHKLIVVTPANSKGNNISAFQIQNGTTGTDPQTTNLIIDNETFPKRCWEYNHIVGCIRISATRQDIVFDLFLPKPMVERYIWHSPRKAFLYDVNANGTHFYTGNMKTNEEIREATDDMLTWMIKDFLPKRYYVDRSGFDNLNRYLDYLGIIKE